MAGMSKEKKEELLKIIGQIEETEKNLRGFLALLQDDLNEEESESNYEALEGQIETVEEECDNLGGTAEMLKDCI